MNNSKPNNSSQASSTSNYPHSYLNTNASPSNNQMFYHQNYNNFQPNYMHGYNQYQHYQQHPSQMVPQNFNHYPNPNYNMQPFLPNSFPPTNYYQSQYQPPHNRQFNNGNNCAATRSNHHQGHSHQNNRNFNK